MTLAIILAAAMQQFTYGSKNLKLLPDIEKLDDATKDKLLLVINNLVKNLKPKKLRLLKIQK